MQPITTVAELQTALRQPRAVLFIHVGWAMHSFRSKAVVQRRLENNPSLSSQIDWFVIDMTDEESELYKYFDSWLVTHEADGRLRDGGYGSVLALRDGRIVGTVIYVAEQWDQFDLLLNQLQSDS